MTLTACMAALLSVGVAYGAGERVINTAPQKDAVILPAGPGFKPIKGENAVGAAYTHNEGIVIRGSYIKDGKIVIPPSGLYYTNRGPRSYHLRGEVLNMLGKPYYLAYFELRAGVIHDMTFKVGETFRPLPEKLFRLAGIPGKFRGHPTPVAMIEVLRPSGVKVGGIDFVSMAPLADDVRDFVMFDKPTGMYDLDASFRFDQHNYSTSLMAGAGLYVKASPIQGNELHVEEALFHGAKFLYVSQTAPRTGYFGAGDAVRLGDFTVTVNKVNASAGTAEVSITDARGTTVTKVMGPISKETMDLMLNSVLEAHQMLSVRDAGFNVQVEMSPFAKDGLFKDGKVALNLYQGLVRFEPEMVWPTDSAYIYRPDT